jgi:hypothetical protein
MILGFGCAKLQLSGEKKRFVKENLRNRGKMSNFAARNEGMKAYPSPPEGRDV